MSLLTYLKKERTKKDNEEQSNYYGAVDIIKLEYNGCESAIITLAVQNFWNCILLLPAGWLAGRQNTGEFQKL